MTGGDRVPQQINTCRMLTNFLAFSPRSNPADWGAYQCLRNLPGRKKQRKLSHSPINS